MSMEQGEQLATESIEEREFSEAQQLPALSLASKLLTWNYGDEALWLCS